MNKTSIPRDFCIRTTGRRIVIIGNGIAGVTCARHLRKRDSNAHITLISGETEHFFSRTALMYIYMGHMKYTHTKPYEDWFWQKNRLNLVHDWVTRINFDQKELILQQHAPIPYDILVLALGSKPNMSGWPGQHLQGVQGLYSYQDLEKMETSTKGCRQAVIVGGGLIGIEMAEMLRSRHIEVTLLVREANFWNNVLPDEEAQLIGRHIREHHIDLRQNVQLKDIRDDGKGGVKSIRTDEGEEIACQFVGLTIGVSPNIGLLQDTPLDVNRGILVDDYFATNMANVFAIGDCVEYRNPPPQRKAVEQVWYTGRMHGETLAHSLTENPVPYKPGPWFNSAKFLDIEYQTYGQVPAQWEAPLQSFYWEHASGKIAFRVLFDGPTKKLHGLHVLGMRLRHEPIDKLLQQGVTVETLLQQLHRLHFDPEFYDKHYHAILHAYNRQFSASLNPAKEKKSFLSAFGF